MHFVNRLWSGCVLTWCKALVKVVIPYYRWMHTKITRSCRLPEMTTIGQKIGDWGEYLQLSRDGVLRWEGVLGGGEGGPEGVVHGEVRRSILVLRQLLPHRLGGRVAGERELEFLTHLCPNGSLGIVNWWVIVDHLPTVVVQRGVKREEKGGIAEWREGRHWRDRQPMVSLPFLSFLIFMLIYPLDIYSF